MAAITRSAVRAAAVALAVMLAAGATAAPAAAAPADTPTKVIINFHARPKAAAMAAVEQAGGKVRHRYRLINAVAATVPSRALAGLRGNALVKSVELDHTIVAFDHGANTGNAELEASWGVEHIGAGDVHNAGNTGAGVRVAVIDTGIDYNHPDLDTVYAGGWDFFNNDADPFDDQGHGTWVSGILAAERNSPPAGVVGVAPDVDLVAYKVLGADGTGDYSGLIAALDRAALVDGIDVVNMSLGGPEPSDALAAAVAAAYASGLVLVAASGNVNPFDFWQLLYGCPVMYPAKYEQVFATTFTGQNNELTGYSCTGPEVDFAAPGDLVYSTVPTGSCPLCAPSGYRGDGSGTSFASPHLAGTVALVLAHGVANGGDAATLADDVKAHLCSTTMLGYGVLTTPIPPDDPRYPEYFGCGVVDANNALITNPPPGGEPPPPPPPDNEPPTAVDDTATTEQDTPVSVSVLANDSDPDGDALTLTAVTQPAHGSAFIDGSAVLYNPAAGYFGPDSFDYTVSDGNGGTATATVSVTVTEPPPPPPPPPPGPTVHVADLDGSTSAQRNGWSAKVTVVVHDGAHVPLSGVTVHGSWSTGASAKCKTNRSGVCSVSLGKLSGSLASVTFNVSNLVRSGWTYESGSNHDPDGDSTGTSIIVLRP